MKTPRRALLTAILLTACFYFSCQKSGTPAGPEPGPGHIAEYTQANISGRITDDQKLPVSGAVVRIGVSSTTTDVNGIFSISNVQVDRTAGLVQVEKEGFFKGIKTLVVTSGKDNQVTIQLIKKVVAGTFNGSSGGTINIPAAGGSIIFEPNSILNTANHAGYTGPVSLSAFFIDPAADNFFDIMPGALRGIDANNNERALKSYGMMVVELTGANGEKLQLSGGKKATLHFPIPASLQGEAPATIPLWSLHDSTGLWKEEGVATKQGPEYIGTVSHFSFWNCDVPYPLVNFTATIQTQQGTALAATRVMITNPDGSSNISGSGYTDNNGVLNGLIQANQALVLKVMDKCGDVLHSQPIGPFSTTANLNITISNLANSIVTVSGTVINCNFSPVTSGYVIVALDNNYFFANIINGSFSLPLVGCTSTSTSASITAMDIDGNRSSETANIVISGTTINTGPLLACSVLPESYCYCSLGDQTYGFATPIDVFSIGKDPQFSPPATTFWGGMPLDMSVRTIAFLLPDQLSLGTYPVLLCVLYQGSGLGTWSLYEPTTATLTEFSTSPGEYVAGNFSCMVRNSSSNTTKPLKCNFRIKRP